MTLGYAGWATRSSGPDRREPHDLRPYRAVLLASKLGDMDALGIPFDPDRCWELLTSGSFGRVAFSIHALPMIVPVRYIVKHNTLHVELPEDADIDGALADAVVAFQADGLDDHAGRAWSVHTVGRVTAEDISGFEFEPSTLQGRWLTFF